MKKHKLLGFPSFFLLKVICIVLFSCFFSSISIAQTPKWKVYNKDNSNFPGGNFLTSNAYDIKIDPAGRIWVATWGVAYYNDTLWTHLHSGNSGIPSVELYTLEIIDDSVKWFGCWNAGLIRYKNAVFDTFTTENSQIPNNLVFDIDLDRKGNLWIASGSSVSKFDEVQFTNYQLGYTAYTVFADREDNIWVGTYNGGLKKFDGLNWTTYTKENSGLPDNIVLEISEDASGMIWICTWGGVSAFDGNNWTTFTAPLVPSNITRSIYIDSDDNKWIGTENGIAKYDNTSWVTITGSSALLEGGIINSMNMDTYGNLWIGTSMMGVYVYNENGIVSGVEEFSEHTADFHLFQNYPNPFNPETVINFDLKNDAFVEIKVYNLNGQLVSVLLESEKPAGSHTLCFNGAGLCSGVYFYSLSVLEKKGDLQREVKKMILLR